MDFTGRTDLGPGRPLPLRTATGTVTAGRGAGDGGGTRCSGVRGGRFPELRAKRWLDVCGEAAPGRRAEWRAEAHGHGGPLALACGEGRGAGLSFPASHMGVAHLGQRRGGSGGRTGWSAGGSGRPWTKARCAWSNRSAWRLELWCKP